MLRSISAFTLLLLSLPASGDGQAPDAKVPKNGAVEANVVVMNAADSSTSASSSASHANNAENNESISQRSEEAFVAALREE